MLRKLVKFDGCGPTFKEAEPFKKLRTAHSFLYKDNFKISLTSAPFSRVLCTAWYNRVVCYSLTSRIRRTTQILLLICYDCVTLSSCSEVLMIEVMQELVQTYQQRYISVW